MIKIDHISFSYGEENENTGGVRDIDLNIEDGQFVVLCGESGCGKTTITRLINGLIPHYYEGQMAGEVWVNGEKVSEQPLYDTAAVVGSVFQNPRSQFFNVDTTSEITFGCENLGQPEKDIRERFAKTVRDFRLEKLMDRNIFHLSGGEKQKIACAGVSIMEPDVLVMDEPSSNLDAASILDLRKILAFWKSQGKTIIVSEHRLYYLRGLADRFIYLAEGQVSRDYSAAEFEQLTEQQRSNMGLRTFALERLLPPVLPQQEKTALALHNFRFAYKNEPETLHIMDCEIPTNRIVGIIGNNGAGKSTFSRCFCGLEKRCGEIVWNGRKYRPKDRLSTCYMVMQEVNHQLFTESVLDEVLISMEEENQERAEEILNRLDLLAFKDRHPMSLSGGQKQRVAIASAIASKRSILFFDEPTSGLDYKHMKEVANVLRQVRDTGITVYVITHDLELILDCCTDIVHFEDGSIIDQFPMDADGLEKIRNYFIKGVSVK
ncbi:MAG: ABC transporter ATP-binding protein [Acutalibacteraceae bacterium]